MPPLTTKEEGKLEVNRQYQEVIKIAINLVTASLVLPVALLSNIFGFTPTQIKPHLSALAYVSWILLSISLVACVTFYFFSTKYTKAIYRLYDEKPKPATVEQMEKLRDIAGVIAAPTAVLGLLCLVIFFMKQLIRN